MPYKDPELERISARFRKRKYRARLHAQRYGPDAGDMRGKHGNHGRGSQHHRWGDGLSRHTQGYLKVRVGPDHRLADPNGYAYLHRLVWEAAGRTLPDGAVLHHINGDKLDNRIENLQALSRSEHNRLHNRARARRANGQFEAAGREHNEFPEARHGR